MPPTGQCRTWWAVRTAPACFSVQAFGDPDSHLATSCDSGTMHAALDTCTVPPELSPAGCTPR